MDLLVLNFFRVRTLSALHVSLNNSYMRTVCKWLNRNNGHLLTLQIWMEWRCCVWIATHEARLKPSSEAQNSFWIKSRTGEHIGQFSAGHINKALQKSRVLPIVWQEYMKMTEDVLSISLFKSVHTYSVCAVLNSWDNFWQRLNC